MALCAASTLSASDVAKRLRLARALGWADASDLVRGRLAGEQWYLGCHRARCVICHPEKVSSYGDRQRAEREWRRQQYRAWGATDDFGIDALVDGTALGRL